VLLLLVLVLPLFRKGNIFFFGDESMSMISVSLSLSLSKRRESLSESIRSPHAKKKAGALLCLSCRCSVQEKEKVLLNV